MKLKFIFPYLCIFLVLSSHAEDLTSEFEFIYKNKIPLTPKEIQTLRQYDFYLAPGILSETFIHDDRRSVFNLAVLTKEYFSSQKSFLKGLQVPVTRLSTSSFSVEESKKIIRRGLQNTLNRGRKSFFITHSLGGLVLLEVLLERENNQDIGGIIFMQSPFLGAPVADVYLDNPFYVQRWIKPILPFFNTSTETLQFLSTSVRKDFIQKENVKIEMLIREVPILTVAGEVNGYRSLFRPSVDLIRYGCINTFFERCLTRVIFAGPYDQSDGMVPVESSKLKDSSFIVLKGVDHGETVVNIPFDSYDRKKTTESLLKLFLCNNQAGTSAIGEVCPGPLKKNKQAIFKSNQIINVNQ